MIKLLHGLPANIAESADMKQVGKYDVKNAIFNGMATARKLGAESFNTDILEQFGLSVSAPIEENNLITNMITENSYNPLLIIHQLREQNDEEGIKNISRAYEQFVEVVNSYCTDEISQANSNLIQQVSEIMELALIKK